MSESSHRPASVGTYETVYRPSPQSLILYSMVVRLRRPAGSSRYARSSNRSAKAHHAHTEAHEAVE